jgi:hypothetical protein
MVLFSGFKNPYKKSAKQENSSQIMKSILPKGKIRVENQTKIRVRDDFMLRNLTKNTVQDVLCRVSVPF